MRGALFILRGAQVCPSLLNRILLRVQGGSCQSYAPQRRMNDYHLYEEIGQGKYSVVYKGARESSKSIRFRNIKIPLEF